MKQALHRISLLLAVAFLTSCGGDSHQKITADLVANMEKVLAAVEDVTDKASAEKAAEKIEKLAGNFEDIKARAEKIGDPDEKTEAMLKEKFEQPMKDLGAKMMGAVMKIAQENPDAMPVIQKAMEKIGDLSSLGG